ncbi:hypothetical protein ZOSMA_99G00840 [Zostera marina]|uniref:Uncharacterized protein n=1 Tax=Zostera marina TaxID=29655 RepID=A0A0K9NHR1_ZOSMR|nr:hypothetical protein ZOSMA_99G00840 [Zostera marina]
MTRNKRDSPEEWVEDMELPPEPKKIRPLDSDDDNLEDFLKAFEEIQEEEDIKSKSAFNSLPAIEGEEDFGSGSEYFHELSFLLEASDDELGLPPTQKMSEETDNLWVVEEDTVINDGFLPNLINSTDGACDDQVFFIEGSFDAVN